MAEGAGGLTTNSEEHGAAVGHVVPLRLLFGVLGALLVLTVVTVAATYVPLGEFNIAIALLIALFKAALVCLYFMHLRWDRPFNAIVLISALALVVLFVLFALLDSYQYQPDTIPGYSPDMPTR
jgi:cytochrome c oxidase subunit 4